MLSNLHSFHFGKLLQNACALPEPIYKDSNNKKLLNNLTNRVDSTMPPASLADNTENPETTPANHSPAPAERLKKPLVTTVFPQQEVSGKHVWKPGRGVIEKVDRETGEIVHLCTE